MATIKIQLKNGKTITRSGDKYNTIKSNNQGITISTQYKGETIYALKWFEDGKPYGPYEQISKP